MRSAACASTFLSKFLLSSILGADECTDTTRAQFLKLCAGTLVLAHGWTNANMLHAQFGTAQKSIRSDSSSTSPKKPTDRLPVVTGVSLSPDTKILATAGDDHVVRLWSMLDGKLLYSLQEHRDWVRSTAFSRWVMCWQQPAKIGLSVFGKSAQVAASKRPTHTNLVFAAFAITQPERQSPPWDLSSCTHLRCRDFEQDKRVHRDLSRYWSSRSFREMVRSLQPVGAMDICGFESLNWR